MIKRGSTVVVGDIPATAIEARHSWYTTGDRGQIISEPVDGMDALVWFGYTRGSHRVPRKYLEVTGAT